MQAAFSQLLPSGLLISQVLVPFHASLQPGDHLGETVELLAACRPAEVALLQSLGGYRRLLMTWR